MGYYPNQAVPDTNIGVLPTNRCFLGQTDITYIPDCFVF